jgi:DNA polymerase I
MRPRGRKYFHRIVVCDFEYEIADGDLPRPLCLVAEILDGNGRHLETIRRWRGEFGNKPPFPTDDDTLVVGYSLWAELTCFMALGWQFPRHLYDLHTAWLATSNILSPAETAQAIVGCLSQLWHRGLAIGR